MSKGNNKARKDELINIYGKECMFTGVKDDLTYHHIDKEEWGAPTDLENGSILSAVSQSWLHNYIEHIDPELYDLINECLILYKKVRDIGNEQLINQYRDEVMPEFIARIVVYDKKNMNRNTKTLVKRR